MTSEKFAELMGNVVDCLYEAILEHCQNCGNYCGETARCRALDNLGEFPLKGNLCISRYQRWINCLHSFSPVDNGASCKEPHEP